MLDRANDDGAQDQVGHKQGDDAAGGRGLSCFALAAAQLLAEDVDAWGMPVLRALLPLAGMTLIEQQAERARAVGVARFLVLVDGVPPALVDACDRIRSRGMDVELVRGGADVLRLGKGHDQVLLVADGLIAGEQAWAATSNARAPTLLVTADASVTQGLERIDAASRWAGLAVLPISALTAIETAPRDWDAQLLLFRSAVQVGAARIAIDPALFVSGDMMVAETNEAVAALERRLLTAQADDACGIGRRYLVGPLVRLFGGTLLGAQQSGTVARCLAPVAFLGAGAAFLFGQPWWALALAIMGVLADEVARFVAGFRTEAKLWSRVGQAALACQWLVLLIGERAASAMAGHSLIGDGIFPLTLLLMLSAISERYRLLVDDALAWLLLGALALLGGWDWAFDWTAMAALAVLIVAIAEPRWSALPWTKRTKAKKD